VLKSDWEFGCILEENILSTNGSVFDSGVATVFLPVSFSSKETRPVRLQASASEDHQKNQQEKGVTESALHPIRLKLDVKSKKYHVLSYYSLVHLLTPPKALK